MDSISGGGDPRQTGQHVVPLPHDTAPGDTKESARGLKVRSRQGKKRIKCDQVWPVCQKCKAAARVCHGYGVWGGGGKPYGPDGHRSKTIRPAAWVSLMHQFGGTGMTAEQHLSLEMLRLKIGVKLSGVFDSEVWDRLMLQASATEPAILHAVAATGSTYRSDRLARGEYVSIDGMDSEGIRALVEYNFAIRCLTVHLSRTVTDICSLRVALITCMLFICFEYLRRNLRTGDTHLVNGLRLLRDIQARRGRSAVAVGNAPNCMDDNLVETFARLNLQCALFGMHLLHAQIPRRSRPESLCAFEILFMFESVQQARRQLDELLAGTYHLLQQCCLSERGHSYSRNEPRQPDLDA
ncbi:hypothetical protein A1O7_02771 [Cladophialophora yegresii CBS 114405]|uniref:Zn(2)-C6 fungal-type domain-containing protein n=1 Tax=Cladophialophora yegresii CBS 114405 TaxID=1182544 RepID=W9W2S5_9EURO|nr:uncharacterized protein A1O7_02771 [Cladophialophora yegresii CBS 114405]EXJ62337.1 hypothetical protein A1O7_02771 [Cladophialophora yegresii CBS 114405]